MLAGPEETLEQTVSDTATADWIKGEGTHIYLFIYLFVHYFCESTLKSYEPCLIHCLSCSAVNNPHSFKNNPRHRGIFCFSSVFYTEECATYHCEL